MSLCENFRAYNQYMKVISLSAIRTGRLYSLGNIPSTETVSGPQCGRKDYVCEYSGDPIGNRTRDLN